MLQQRLHLGRSDLIVCCVDCCDNLLADCCSCCSSAEIVDKKQQLKNVKKKEMLQMSCRARSNQFPQPWTCSGETGKYDSKTTSASTMHASKQQTKTPHGYTQVTQEQFTFPLPCCRRLTCSRPSTSTAPNERILQ